MTCKDCIHHGVCRFTYDETDPIDIYESFTTYTAEKHCDDFFKAGMREEKHGKWIFTRYYGYNHCPIYECTNCHKSVEDNYIHKHKWCLHCGARMDGVKE